MKLEESFEVDAPVGEVWKALIDVERVAPCLPGAEITEASDDGIYHGNFKVKLGPTTAAYTGTLELESVDEAARVATMNASGRDKRGQGGAKAKMVSKVVEAEGGGARVDVETDFTITGRLARFGRGGMIQDISKRLLTDFSACLQAELAAKPAPSPDEREAAAASAAAEDSGAGASGESSSPSSSSTSGQPTAIGAGAAPPGTAPRPRPPTKPISGFALFLSVLRDRIRRFVARRRRR